MKQDWAWKEAAKELDREFPETPPLYIEPERIKGPFLALPRGWSYNQFMDSYSGPNGQRVEGLAVAMSGDPDKFWTNKAADLSDILQMASIAK